MAKVLGANGRSCTHHTIESIYGHDGFLVEHDKLASMLVEFLDKVSVDTH